MKATRVTLAGLVIVLVAGAFYLTRPASGQAPSLPVNRFPVGKNFAYGSAARLTADPETAKMLTQENAADREAAALVKEYAGTEDEGRRAKIKSKLAEVLAKQFDLQQNRRDLELKRVEAQVKKVREVLKKRSEAKTTIVDRRLEQLLREADGLGWTPPGGPSAQNSSASNPHLAPFPAQPTGVPETRQ
jgi:hypothetical protein